MSNSIYYDFIRCASFAAECHKHQTRKSDGGSYITHPLGVAKFIMEAGCDTPEVIMAAMVHDVAEDTKYTINDIEKELGPVIANIVSEVSDNKDMDKISRKKKQIAHCTEISKAAQIVKLGDKYHNLADMKQNMPPKGWSVERVQGYFLWALTIVDKIKGANETLANAIFDLSKGTFNLEGAKYPCVSNDMTLEKYYKILEASLEK